MIHSLNLNITPHPFLDFHLNRDRVMVKRCIIQNQHQKHMTLWIIQQIVAFNIVFNIAHHGRYKRMILLSAALGAVFRARMVGFHQQLFKTMMEVESRKDLCIQIFFNLASGYM